MWYVMNGSVMIRSVANVVCFEREPADPKIRKLSYFDLFFHYLPQKCG